MKNSLKALLVTGGAMALVSASTALGQATDERPVSVRSAQVSDDIGPDGLKRRGDGSIDDDNFRGDSNHKDRLHRSGRDRDGRHERGRDRDRADRGDRLRDDDRGRDRGRGRD